MDLTRVYLSAGRGVGQRLAVGTIDKRLSSLPLSRTLVLLAQVAQRLDKTIGDRAAQIDVATALFRPTAAAQAVTLIRSDPKIGLPSSQVVLNLALHALCYCDENDNPSLSEADLTFDLGDLVLGMADHVSTDYRTEDALRLEFARLALWFKIHDLSAWLEVANRLLFEVLPALHADPDYFDANEVIENHTGLCLELIWALTGTYGINAKQSDSGFKVPRPIEGDEVTNEQMQLWLDALSHSISDARSLAETDIAAGTTWSFDAFYRWPVIRMDDTSGLVMRPVFLAWAATPSGMFWQIRDPYVAAGGDHEAWSRLYGKAVETLGRTYLVEHSGPDVWMLHEDEIRKRWGDGPACDALRVGDRWIAIDFVFRQMTRGTAATGDFSHLVDDLRKSVVKKVRDQIDPMLTRGLESEDAPAAIYPLVVIGAPFPSTPLTLSAVHQVIESDASSEQTTHSELAVIGVHDACRPIAVMDLAEFTVLLQTSTATGISVEDLLEGWLTSDLYDCPFRDWAVTEGPAGDLPGGGAIASTWQERFNQWVHGETDQESA